MRSIGTFELEAEKDIRSREHLTKVSSFFVEILPLSHDLFVAGELFYKDGLYYSKGHIIQSEEGTEEGGTMDSSGSKDQFNGLWAGNYLFLKVF